MLYLAARFLGMDAQTWDRQPYWAQRIYTEGLLAERPWQTKIDADSGQWVSNLDGIWETFGELSTTYDDGNNSNNDTNDMAQQSTKVTIDEGPVVESEDIVDYSKLSDISTFGARITKIDL